MLGKLTRISGSAYTARRKADTCGEGGEARAEAGRCSAVSQTLHEHCTGCSRSWYG
jgi:hypothetical protein